MTVIDLVARGCVILFGIVGTPCVLIIAAAWLIDRAFRNAEFIQKFMKFCMQEYNKKEFPNASTPLEAHDQERPSRRHHSP